MAGFAIYFFILLLPAIPIVAIYLLYRWLRTRWINADEGHRGERIAIVLAGALAVTSPYSLFKAYELHVVLARVPEPLHVSWIEYRLEEAWGIGLPGDNETGFVVYRMTAGSTDWARSKGRNLGSMLPGGSSNWRPTPVDDNSSRNRWHRNGDAANLKQYLGTYGFPIPLEDGRDIEFNDAVQHPGSFYSYGLGGSVTVVDPKRGKIYFAYAG